MSCVATLLVMLQSFDNIATFLVILQPFGDTWVLAALLDGKISQTLHQHVNEFNSFLSNQSNQCAVTLSLNSTYVANPTFLSWLGHLIFCIHIIDLLDKH